MRRRLARTELLASLHHALHPRFPRSFADPSAGGRGGGDYTVRRGLRVTSAPPPGAEEQVALLSAARAAATARVVVKRPIDAPPLAGVAPDEQRCSALPRRRRRVRYDVYLCDQTEAKSHGRGAIPADRGLRG